MSALKTCPSCHSQDIELIHRYQAEKLLSFLSLFPYRCYDCDRYFYSNVRGCLPSTPEPNTSTATNHLSARRIASR